MLFGMHDVAKTLLGIAGAANMGFFTHSCTMHAWPLHVNCFLTPSLTGKS